MWRYEMGKGGKAFLIGLVVLDFVLIIIEMSL
nr:MAG TPA: hypothetical protein [Caudoviricetes sp.]